MILSSTLLELIKRRLVTTPLADFKFEAFSMLSVDGHATATSQSAALFRLVESCKSSTKYASGRALRRLPLVAHSRYIRSRQACSLDAILTAMQKTVTASDD